MNPFDTTVDESRLAERVPVEAFSELWEALEDVPLDEGGHGTDRRFYVHLATRISTWRRPTWNVHRQLDARALAEASAKRDQRVREQQHREREQLRSAAKSKPTGVLARLKAAVTSSAGSRPVTAELAGGTRPGVVEAAFTPAPAMLGLVARKRLEASIRGDLIRRAPDVAVEAESRDRGLWARMASMSEIEREAETKRLLDRQAEQDFRDSPEWWSQLGLRDDAESGGRGFAGGGGGSTDAEHSKQIDQLAERAGRVVSAASRDRRLLELELMRELDRMSEAARGFVSSFQQPKCVQDVVDRSTELTDARDKAKHESEAQKRRLREREERIRAPRRSQRSDTVESSFGTGDAFQSLGFRGVVAPDGSLLEWAGNGAEFDLVKWELRRSAQPWKLNAALMRYVMSRQGQRQTGPENEQGSDALSGQDVADAITAAGGAELLMQYRLGAVEPVDDPMGDAGNAPASGFTGAAGLEARREAMMDRQRRTAKLLEDEPGVAGLVKRGIERAERERADALRAKQAEAVALADDEDRITCVAALHVTWGHREAAAFATRQRDRAERGSRIFFADRCDFGRDGEPCLVWVNYARSRTEGVTELVLGPADAAPGSATAKLADQGFTSVSHPAALGDLALWSRQGRGRPITSLAASASTDDEFRLRSRGYTRLRAELAGEFIDKDAGLWICKTPVTDGPSGLEPDEEVQAAKDQELKWAQAYADSLRPDDSDDDAEAAGLQTGVQPGPTAESRRLRARERVAAERALQRCKVLASQSRADALVAAASDFLNLDKLDVRRMKKAFEHLVRFHGGAGTAREISRLLGVRWTPVVEALFFFGDADANPDSVTFASFVRTFVLGASFGVAEVLAFMFFIAAPNMVRKVPSARSRPPSGSLTDRIRPPSAATVAARATSALDASPRDYWRFAVEAVRHRQQEQGTRDTDRAHELRCVFAGEEAMWSGVVGAGQIDETVPASGARRALAVLGWGLVDAEDVVNDAMVEVEQCTDGDGASFVAFKRAVARRPRLLLSALSSLRALRVAFMGANWWSDREVDMARARAVIQSRIEVMQSLRPQRKTAEEAFAALA